MVAQENPISSPPIPPAISCGHTRMSSGSKERGGWKSNPLLLVVVQLSPKRQGSADRFTAAGLPQPVYQTNVYYFFAAAFLAAAFFGAAFFAGAAFTAAGAALAAGVYFLSSHKPPASVSVLALVFMYAWTNECPSRVCLCPSRFSLSRSHTHNHFL